MTRHFCCAKLAEEVGRFALKIRSGGGVTRRIRDKRRRVNPLWKSLPGTEAIAIEAGDVPGPVSQSPYANEPAKVYVLADADDCILYVGATRAPDPATRMKQHAADKPWWPEVATVLWEDQPSWQQALLRESELTHRLQPRYNAGWAEIHAL